MTATRYLPMAGQILDATLVAAPRQRNTAEEKARIKAGEKAAAIWPDKPARARQKDTDARWRVKVRKTRPGPDGTPRSDSPPRLGPLLGRAALQKSASSARLLGNAGPPCCLQSGHRPFGSASGRGGALRWRSVA